MISTIMLIDGAVYGLIGMFAGLMAGLLGIGGGIIVVPGLAFIFQHVAFIPKDSIMHVAAGSSLAVMILTSQSSLRAHFRLNGVKWEAFNKLWPGIIVGTVCGALLAHLIPTHWLKVLFALFLILVAIKMLTDLHVTHPERFPPNWVNRGFSFFVGLISGLLGVGGGMLIIPYLTYCGIAIRNIAAVSNLCSFTVAVVGTMVFILTGWQEMSLTPYATGYIYWPAVLWVAIPSVIFAPLGAKLNYIIPVKVLKYGFIVILTITAINMFF